MLKRSKILWVVLALILLVLIQILLIIMNMKEETFIPHEDELNASEDEFLYLEYLDRLNISSKHSNESQIIHFLEGYGHSSLSTRTWCAIESAGNKNPFAKIILHMKSERILLNKPAKIVLENYNNIHVVKLNEKNIFMESVLSKFYQDKVYESSKWPISHFNDALR